MIHCIIGKIEHSISCLPLQLMIRALDDPACRDVAAGLLPRLLPILINRALSTVNTFSIDTTSKPQQVLSESRSLALDLLLAAARVANPSCLKNALPQLTIAGLQAMGALKPNHVVSIMRPSTLPSTSAMPSLYSLSLTIKELQMAEVLRLVSPTQTK